jgi:SAM-dependent methyltransferase
MAEPAFDVEGVFDEDYLYFYADRLTDAQSDAETELIVRLLDPEPGMQVLDLACGHGRIANRLAARGYRVTGLDATPMFLDLARRDAQASGLTVDYVHGDMRQLPWRERFDCVVNWFTAFGYFEDADCRRVLGQVAQALRPGGRFVIDLNNRDRLIRAFQPDHVVERGEDFMIDRAELEALTGRITTERTVVRGGHVRRTSFFVRLFTFTELRDWLYDAGFSAVDGYGDDGAPLSTTSRRLIVVAGR